MYLLVALPLKLENAEAREGVMLNAFEPKIESKDDKKEWSTVHMRSGRIVKHPVLYMKEYSSGGVEGALSKIHQNYYSQLYKPDEDEAKNIKIAVVGAGLGGRFDHTSELNVLVQGSYEQTR